MIVQIFPALTSAVSGIAGLFGGGAAPAAPSLLSQIGAGLSTAFTETILPAATQFGGNLLSGLAQAELARGQTRAVKDAIKSAARIQANAASPVVSPQQGPVFSGGAPTGQAVMPPTVFPPSTLPIPQQLEINPNFLLPGPPQPVPVSDSRGRPIRFGGLGAGASGVTQSHLPGSRPPTPTLAGTFPLDPFAFRQPVQQMVQAVQGGATMPTGAPTSVGPGGVLGFHRYAQKPDGTGSQIFVCNDRAAGPGMVTIEQAPALGIPVEGATRYRFDIQKQRFVKLKRRRMNPTNTRAFFRAGRRIDAMERIARNLFSEKRKAKNATVKRKTRRKKRA